MTALVPAGRTRAVQYLRMSTEHQRYSIENQQARIAEYAAAQGYDIVGTYADAGRSGLTLKERKELNRLLRDVTDPDRQFSAILVLDVSRWGRFQDPDQHAAYEFVCRDLGVQVEYIGEPFANDGSFASSMMKHMKRIMAGEYSRDLSAKITYGQLRAAGRGFKQGGTVTYGLRRLLVDPDGQPKHELMDGERKALIEDKVVIVPGPQNEREVIVAIFDMYLAGASVTSIARHLNHKGVPATLNTPWSFQKVKWILTSELYTGVYVFNRFSKKLKTPRIENPASLWIKVPMCEGIISRKTFDKAQAAIATRRGGHGNRYSSEKMLAGLRRLLAEEGRLSADLIKACPYVPDIATYYSRFGKIAEIYERVGYRRQLSRLPKVKRAHRNRPYAKAELLGHLKRALKEHGALSPAVLRKCPYTASLRVYALAFGSLPAAYRAAGYEYRQMDPAFPHGCDKADALVKLKRLWDRQGYINRSSVSADKSMPSPNWYLTHFGSFANACEAAGIDYDYGAGLVMGKFRTHREYIDCPDGGNGGNINAGELSDEALLQAVRRIFNENGYITVQLIVEDPETPNINQIRKRYASISHLYAAAGLPKDMDYLRIAERVRQRRAANADKKKQRAQKSHAPARPS